MGSAIVFEEEVLEEAEGFEDKEFLASSLVDDATDEMADPVLSIPPAERIVMAADGVLAAGAKPPLPGTSGRRCDFTLLESRHCPCDAP